jgi:hypothetical protein
VAKIKLGECGVGTRLPKRKGDGKEKTTVEDLLKVMLEPSTHLPDFTASKLSKIPPVGIEDVDMAAVLAELTTLRMQVKEFLKWKDEFEEKLNQKPTEKSGDVKTYANVTASVEAGARVEVVQATASHTTSGRGGETKKQGIPNPKAGNRVIVGKSTSTGIAVVPMKRQLNYFVSRLDASTTAQELQNMLNDKLSGRVRIECEKLVTKFDSYASFRVDFFIDQCDCQTMREIIEEGELWPENSLVRRFWIPKGNRRKDH